MARPKKNAEDKKQAQPVPQVAPQPQQPMMPQGAAPQPMAYQNMAPQMALPQMPQPQPQQMPRQHQFQQFAPQVQMPQQQPPPQMPQQPIPMPQQNVAGRVVDGESFLSVRDSTLTRLATITELLRSLTQDYLRHTSLLLGDTSDANQVDLLANFETAAASAAQAMQLSENAPAPVVPVEEKKERKKRTHDPNAPKRPLTPYFLYMQHARGIISTDLGAEARKGAVQDEGQRRWASMGVEEKKGWNQAYQYNLRLYNARTMSYKQGNLEAKNMNDNDALDFANANGLPEVPPAEGDMGAALVMGDPTDNDAIAQQLQGGIEAPAMPVPASAAKTPKKAAGGRKRKSEAADTDSKAATPAAAPASPAKRRRSTKAAAGAETPVAEETKPKGRGGKKTKSS